MPASVRAGDLKMSGGGHLDGLAGTLEVGLRNEQQIPDWPSGWHHRVLCCRAPCGHWPTDGKKLGGSAGDAWHDGTPSQSLRAGLKPAIRAAGRYRSYLARARAN